MFAGIVKLFFLNIKICQIFMKEPFFQGSDNYDQLDKIAKVLGANELMVN